MKIYVSNYLSHSISIIDYETLETEKEIYLGEDIFPHHFCIDTEEKRIFIPSVNSGLLYVLDIDSERIIDFASIGGSLSQVFLYKNELFILNEDTNSIYIINKYTLEPMTMISVDEMPHGFSYHKRLKKLYVSCIDSIISIDIESKEVCDKIRTDFKAWHIEVDENKDEIYISTLDGKLVVLDLEKFCIKREFSELLLPVKISFNYKDNKVYVSDFGYNKIKIFEYTTGKYLGSININGIPQGLQISKDCDRLFVSDTKNNALKIYSTKNNTLIKVINIGKEPTTIACM